MRRLPLALAALTVLAGCGSSSLVAPEAARAEISSARDALSQAEQADAGARAPVALRMARQKVEEAQTALSTGDPDRADRLAREAAVDARLAEVSSRADVAETAVAEVREAIRALREEIDRNRRTN